MEFMHVLAERRSIRAYTPQTVDRALVRRLVGSAVLAPSGMNSQPWAFGVIEGRDQLRALSARVKDSLIEKFGSDPTFERYREWLLDPQYNVFYEAPVLVLVCGRATGYDSTGACAMAAYSLMLAARNEGLGSCWIGFAEGLFQATETKAEFGIPADYRVVAPIILGYPAAPVPPTPRAEPQFLFWREEGGR
jgi:nitroreductase